MANAFKIHNTDETRKSRPIYQVLIFQDSDSVVVTCQDPSNQKRLTDELLIAGFKQLGGK